MAQGQASLEALISIAALTAFLSVLIYAASDYSDASHRLAHSLLYQARADTLALEINIHAADGRLTSFTSVPFEGCNLAANSIYCGNHSAEIPAGTSGHETYGYFTLPT